MKTDKQKQLCFVKRRRDHWIKYLYGLFLSLFSDRDRKVDTDTLKKKEKEKKGRLLKW